jgi:asparagine N-glycosylation enzyme membrane subunit Stt3
VSQRGTAVGLKIALEERQPLSKEGTVLWTIFIILLILWLLGLVSGYTIGGFIHILLLIALVVVVIRVIQGRRPI